MEEALGKLAKLNEACRESLSVIHDTKAWNTWDAVFEECMLWFTEHSMPVDQDRKTGEWKFKEKPE